MPDYPKYALSLRVHSRPSLPRLVSPPPTPDFILAMPPANEGNPPMPMSLSAQLIQAVVPSAGQDSWIWTLSLIGLSSLTLILVLFVLRRTRRVVLDWLRHHTQSATQRISSRQLRLIGELHLFRLCRITVSFISLLLMLGSLAAWLTLVLDLLPGTHDIAISVEQVFLQAMIDTGNAILGSLPGLAVVLVIVLLTRLIHELSNHYFSAVAEGSAHSELFDSMTAETTRRMVGIALWLFALVMAYPYLPGSHSDAFKGISVVLGLMLSLGSTNMVNQLSCGLVLIYTRSVRPGDVVDTPSGTGVVERIGLFSTDLRTIQEEVITIPNSKLNEGLKNLTRVKGKAAVLCIATMTIGYDAPWRKVREMLLAAAAESEGVRTDPAPVVRQAALEDFYVRYELVFAPTEPAQRANILGRVYENIQDRFHSNGVQIMSPHYFSDPATPKIPASPQEPST